MKKFAHIVLILIILGCCTNIPKAEQIGKDNIVIIFDSIFTNTDTLFYPDGKEEIIYGPQLIFNTDVYPLSIPVVSKIENDTLVIPLQGSYIITRYRYFLNNTIEFIAEKGDSLIIRYKENMPFIEVQNRRVNPHEMNFDYYTLLRYKRSVVNRNAAQEVEFNFDTKQLDENELKDQKSWLDSLKTSNEPISEQAYDYFTTRNKYDILHSSVSNLSRKELQNILYTFNDSLFINDEYGFYRFYFDRIASEYYLDKVIRSSNGSSDKNYKHGYDQLDKDNEVSVILKNILKVRWFNKIVEQNPTTVAKTYYDSLLAQISDTAAIKFLKNEYSERFDESIIKSKEMEISDEYGNRCTFQKILEENKGKVIYVDFWASWCAPCLAEMPNAKQLREEYRNKNVIFVYITLDENRNNWLKSSKEKAGLNDTKHNYFIINLKTSPMLKDLKVRSIPRYLLYDKNGKLVHENAPGPSSSHTKALLDKYIKKEEEYK